MSHSRYEKDFFAETYLCDFQGNMSPSGMLRCAQSIAIEHVERLGYGEDVLSRAKCAFMLSKIVVDIKAPIKSESSARLATTPFAPDRILYPRRTEFYQDGTLRAVINALWLLVDTEKKRILRTSAALDGFPFEDGHIDCDFLMPADLALEDAGAIHVSYSMVDTNGHMNNAAYADAALDLFSDKLFSGAQIKRMILGYSRQAEPGAYIDMKIDRQKNALKGYIGGAMCFEAAAEFI